METDVLAFGERLIAAIPALRAQAGRMASEHDAADSLVRATVARAWRKRAAGVDSDMRAWLGALMRHEYAVRAGEPRSFGAGA